MATWITIVFISSFLLVQSPVTAYTISTSSFERTATNIELIIDYGNSTQQVITGISGLTAFDALDQSASIIYTQHNYGRFVTAINGISNNANGNGRYWQFWVNNELAPIAADFYELTDGDQVLWKYCSPENAHTGSPLNDFNLLAGLILIAFFAGLLIGIVLLVNRRLR